MHVYTRAEIFEDPGCMEGVEDALERLPCDLLHAIGALALQLSFAAEPPPCTRALFVRQELCDVTRQALRRAGLLDDYMMQWYAMRLAHATRTLTRPGTRFLLVYHAQAPRRPLDAALAAQLAENFDRAEAFASGFGTLAEAYPVEDGGYLTHSVAFLGAGAGCDAFTYAVMGGEAGVRCSAGGVVGWDEAEALVGDMLREIRRDAVLSGCGQTDVAVYPLKGEGTPTAAALQSLCMSQLVLQGAIARFPC